MQTARVGRLEAGRHCFACAAFNVAGCSSPVSVTVDPVASCIYDVSVNGENAERKHYQLPYTSSFPGFTNSKLQQK
jgi:hypothetical protein